MKRQSALAIVYGEATLKPPLTKMVASRGWWTKLPVAISILFSIAMLLFWIADCYSITTAHNQSYIDWSLKDDNNMEFGSERFTLHGCSIIDPNNNVLNCDYTFTWYDSDYKILNLSVKTGPPSCSRGTADVHLSFEGVPVKSFSAPANETFQTYPRAGVGYNNPGLFAEIFLRDDTCDDDYLYCQDVKVTLYGIHLKDEENPVNNGGSEDHPFTAFDGGKGPGQCSVGLPNYEVNTSLLALVAEDTDFAYQSFGHRVTMKRTWNMPPATGGMFGNGWKFAYESTLHAFAYTSGGATLTLGSGQVLSYSVSGSQGQGSGTVTVNYACQSTGRRPVLTGYLDETSGTVHYLLYDKDRRLTSRYEYDRVDTVWGGAVYRLVSVTDDNCNAMTIGYDGSGRLVSLTDASNRATSFTYNAQSRVSAMQTFAGNSTSYTYDASGNLSTTTDLYGNVSTFAYDADKYLTSMTTPGKTTTFAYSTISDRKRLSTVTDPLGNITSYSMVSGETRVTDPGGGTRAFANTSGLTNMIRNPMNQTTSVSYNNAGLPTSINYPDGATETFQYDASGNLIRYVDAGNAVTTMTYTGAGDLATLTDPLNNIWTRTYDGKRNLTGLKTPLNRQTILAYDSKGQLTSLTVPGGATYTSTYDIHGNLSSLTEPTGANVQFAYDTYGLERTTSIDGRGNASTIARDANGRLTQLTLPDGVQYNLAYDCCALSSVSGPGDSVITFERDALLNITSVVDPMGKAMNLAYDADSLLTSENDSLNRVTNFVYDEMGRVTRITSPLGGNADFGYNERGLVSSLTDRRGKTTTFSYDQRGLLASQTNPLNHPVFSLNRDGLGRVNTWTNGRNQQVFYIYDADGRVTEKKHDAATASKYSWNMPGFLTSVSDPSGISGTLLFTRDPSGRVTTATYPDALTLGLTYDQAGNVATITYPGGMIVTYTYDAQNRPVKAAFDGKTIDIAYDAAGHMNAESRSSGVTSLYTFDKAGRMTRIWHVNGDGTLVDLAQSRDAVGQITEESGTVPVGPTLPTKQVSGSYDDVGRIVAFGSDVFTYDDDGNVTAVNGSRTLALAYDNENRVTSLTSGSITKTFLYNGLGDRVRSTIGETTRNFRFDPFGRLAFETNGQGMVTNLYIWVGTRLVAYGTIPDGFTWPLYDRVGSTLALTDSTGTMTAGYAYEPYGAPRGKTGSATSSFTYVGAFGVMDEGGGIYFMKNRYYDSTTGRFLQIDPIGFAGGENLYRYVGSNPISRIDPEGKDDMYDNAFVSRPYEGFSEIMTNNESKMFPLEVAQYEAKTNLHIYDLIETGYYVGDKAMIFTPLSFPYTYGKISYYLFYVGFYEGKWNESFGGAGSELMKSILGDAFNSLYGNGAGECRDLWIDHFADFGSLDTQLKNFFQVAGPIIKESIKIEDKKAATRKYWGRWR